MLASGITSAQRRVEILNLRMKLVGAIEFGRAMVGDYGNGEAIRDVDVLSLTECSSYDLA